MSAKNTDKRGRLRSKTVAFRMSPEEADLLQHMTDASGMTKQDYLIKRALCHEVTVILNKRMQRYMEEGMLFVYKELRRIEVGGDIPEELTDLACMLGGIIAGLGREIDEEPRQSERTAAFREYSEAMTHAILPFKRTLS